MKEKNIFRKIGSSIYNAPLAIYSSLGGLIIADVITTLIALSTKHLEETNPVYNIFKSTQTGILVTHVVALIIIAMAYKLDPYEKNLRKWVLVVTVIYAVVFLNNTIRLLILM